MGRSLPDRHAGNIEARAVDAVIGGHVERAPVVVAPGEIGAVAGNAQAPAQAPGGVDDVDAAGPRAIDVALLVAFHAVGDARLGASKLMEDAAVAHAAVGIDVEGAD